MKRPAVRVTLKTDAGEFLHVETRRTMNAAIRASEAAMRELARKRGLIYEGARPERAGPEYKRRWTSPRGAPVDAIVTQAPWDPACAFGDEKSVAEHEARANWERDMAEFVRGAPYGEILATAHTRTAETYERQIKLMRAG